MFGTTFAALLLVSVASGQGPQPSLDCDNGTWRVNGLETYCKMVEIPADSAGALNVKSGNGSITVRVWDNPGVLVRAKVQTAAATALEAMLFADRITIAVAGTQVQANGPQSTYTLNWSVSWEVFVPRAMDLNLTAGNGAINVSDVAGHLQFSVGNGAVSLTNLAGQVEGAAGNGAITMMLGGDHWDGAGVNVKTGNGTITVHVPQDYSAHFDASTSIGTISTNYPVHVSRSKWGFPGLGGSLSFDAGAGGAPIRVSTGIGTIKIFTD
jgi:DUF4097 and DUF4098 domain-containing protein YvlB